MKIEELIEILEEKYFILINNKESNTTRHLASRIIAQNIVEHIIEKPEISINFNKAVRENWKINKKIKHEKTGENLLFEYKNSQSGKLFFLVHNLEIPYNLENAFQFIWSEASNFANHELRGKGNKKMIESSLIFINEILKWFYKSNELDCSFIKESYPKYYHKIDSFEFSIFNYVAVLDQFYLQTPVSLIEKLMPEEWELEKLSIFSNKENNFLTYTFNTKTKTSFLQLNDKGKEATIAIEFDDTLIFKILDFCDTTIPDEKELFTKITLKKYFFFAIFKNFSLDFYPLINSSNLPSIKKRTLLYRLMGFYYAELGDYKKMNESFKNCIELLQIENSEESSSFYLNWADIEIKFDRENVAIEIYKRALNDLPFPKNKNRTIRFALSTYYFENNYKDQAISYWTQDNYSLLKTHDFIEIFYDYILGLIKRNPKKATVCQDFILYLIKEYSYSGFQNEATELLEMINEKISNNFRFRRALVHYYIATYKEKALELIKKIEQDQVMKPEMIVGLYMDYYLAEKNPDLAIWYAENSIEENDFEDVSYIYLKAGNISFREKKNLEEAKFYYEKVDDEILNSYYQYAVVLNKLDSIANKDLIFQVFQNYFKKYPESTNTKAIGNFITFCLKNKNWKSAISLIVDKLQNINSNENYTNYFVSFLYQQQLRLTINHEQAEILLKTALLYCHNRPQEAIIYSGYAKHLMHRESEKQINSSVYDLQEAIEYFRIANKIRQDDVTLLSIAKCYFKLEEYSNCIKHLNKIRKSSLYRNKLSMKIKSLFFLRNFKEIERLTDSIKIRHIKGLGYFYLAQNWRTSVKNREIYFEKAIKHNTKKEIKFERTIFYYEIEKQEKSINLINELKSSLKSEDEKIDLQSQFNKRVSKYISKAHPELIKRIQRSINDLVKHDTKILYGIDKLIKKYPLDIQINTLKFNYYFKIKNFKACNLILDNLILENLINKKTSRLFLELSKSYYEYSQYYNPRKKVDRKRQIKALINAFKYMEYVLKVNPSIENYAFYSAIAFKQGNFKMHDKIRKYFYKRLNEEEVKTLNQNIDAYKKSIKVFLWETRDGDYENQLLFYRNQEKLAANIIRTSGRKIPSKPIKILKSILLDSEFHQKNKYLLYNNIITRLGHYYYFYQKNYKTAFFYKKQVYRMKANNVPFIRAYLKTTYEVIDKKHQYEKALEVCDFYLENIQIPTIYRYKGNFLKEIKKYKEAYASYMKALKLFNKPYYKMMIHNNIIMLCYTSLLEVQKSFESVSNIQKIANDSFREIMRIDSNYEYRDSAFKQLNLIKSFKDMKR